MWIMDITDFKSTLMNLSVIRKLWPALKWAGQFKIGPDGFKTVQGLQISL